MGTLLFISRLLLAYYIDNQKADHDQSVREKQVLSQTLEGLVSLITIIIQRYKQDLTKFLGSLGESTYHLTIVMHQSLVTSSPSPGVTDNNNNSEI